MALHVNIPKTTGIPAEIFDRLQNLNSLRPSLWEEDWVVSLIEGPNEYWELKLIDKNGIPRPSTNIFPEQQNSIAVCASLLVLRTVQILG
jgi:hypothetical protein